MRLIFSAVIGVMLGYLFGISFPTVNITKDLTSQPRYSQKAMMQQSKRYIELVRKHGLEISQPGLEPDRGLIWEMTKRVTEERPGWCTDPHLPPCAAARLRMEEHHRKG
ncbi:hypothetical protein E2562_007530 [Oryza meyeriana var. granulata]|uniref:Uncharacterized protein n=1 Tax=Oryza meyeriana var. granulata TaxID=110450 RepID=A0A6G1DW69_9ORYZ|nr:hypothetical protein E2562_007530 [Oryza meyeriana var. granulata]